MSNGRFDEWALQAYVDGEVADDQRDDIQAYLRDHPEEAQRVADWEDQRRMLHRGFDGVLDEPVPASLLATARQGGGWRSRPYLAIAASLLLFIAGSLAGWYAGHDTAVAPLQSLASRAILAHEIYAAEIKHPVEVAASDRDHLQSWLSKRLGNAFVVPDLQAQGYSLLGGRLLTAEDGPAAQLMYEDASKKRLTIFLAGNALKTETAVRLQEKGALIACFWMDGPFAVAVAGEMDRDTMMRLAQFVYDQFEA